MRFINGNSESRNGIKSAIFHLVKHTNRMDIGTEIKEDVLENLNVSSSTYYRWMNNETQPDWREMQLVLHIFQKHDKNITMQDLAPSIYEEVPA